MTSRRHARRRHPHTHQAPRGALADSARRSRHHGHLALELHDVTNYNGTNDHAVGSVAMTYLLWGFYAILVPPLSADCAPDFLVTMCHAEPPRGQRFLQRVRRRRVRGQPLVLHAIVGCSDSLNLICFSSHALLAPLRRNCKDPPCTSRVPAGSAQPEYSCATFAAHCMAEVPLLPSSAACRQPPQVVATSAYLCCRPPTERPVVATTKSQLRAALCAAPAHPHVDFCRGAWCPCLPQGPCQTTSVFPLASFAAGRPTLLFIFTVAGCSLIY